MAKKEIDVHIVKSKKEEGSLSCGMHFHGIEKRIDSEALGLTLRNLPTYPPISLLRKPTSVYWENLYTKNISKVVERARFLDDSKEAYDPRLFYVRR